MQYFSMDHVVTFDFGGSKEVDNQLVLESLGL